MLQESGHSAVLAAGALLIAVCGMAAVRSAHPSESPAPRAVVPDLPRLWRIPPPKRATIDYALPAQADAWVRHPILGDPSFDSFIRRPGPPIVRGTAPFKWPVNGSLLIDPVSSRWYAYVGLYLEGYALGPGLPTTHCEVFRSADRGATWTRMGPVFDDPSFRFEGDSVPSNIAPDVKVVYHDGLYHMSYDWCTDNTTWQNASAPRDGADSGVAYAWSERPEGPFHRNPRPILRTSEVQIWNQHSARYDRAYAISLIRRQHDWLVLVNLDSGPHFAWGQVALTASDPRGPWSKPTMIASLEGDSYYPSPVEAFPAFARDGYVYDPRTSVGMNRSFQLVMRAPIEQAHRPEAWSIYQHGSAWHAEWTPDEGYGIWGQTFAAAFDSEGRMQALFPSRHLADGAGAINLASRSWNQPFRKRGFTISAHGARSMTLTRTAYDDFDLAADVTLRGAAARIAWNYAGALGAEGRADGRPHPLAWSSHDALELSPSAWRVIHADSAGVPHEVAGGQVADSARRRLRITRIGEVASIELDGRVVWKGTTAATELPLALLLEPGTNLSVTRFAVTGVPRPARQVWLYSEAIAGAGVAEGSYDRLEGTVWRCGIGAICRTPRERVKWNFRGRAFALWLPRGPSYGRVTAILDGVPAGTLDLHADSAMESAAVLTREHLPDGFHALVLRGDDRPMPVDCLEAIQ